MRIVFVSLSYWALFAHPCLFSSFSGDDDDVNACEDRYDSMGYGDESECWVDEEY